MWKKQFEEKLLNLKTRVKELEKKSHKPKKFVVCEECKCKIKEK